MTSRQAKETILAEKLESWQGRSDSLGSSKEQQWALLFLCSLKGWKLVLTGLLGRACSAGAILWRAWASVNRVKMCVICFHYTLACNETGGLFVFCFCFFYCKLCMIDSHFKELANVGRIVVFPNLLWMIKTSVCIALYFSSYGAHEFQRRGPVGMLMGNSGSSWNDIWWSEKLSVESVPLSGSTCLVMEGGSSICGWHFCFFVCLFWKLTTTSWLPCMWCTVHIGVFFFLWFMVVKAIAFSFEISLSFRSTPYKWYKLEYLFSLGVSDGESRKH